MNRDEYYRQVWERQAAEMRARGARQRAVAADPARSSWSPVLRALIIGFVAVIAVGVAMFIAVEIVGVMTPAPPPNHPTCAVGLPSECNK